MVLPDAIQCYLDQRRTANLARGTLTLYACHLWTWRDFLGRSGRAEIAISAIAIEDLRDFGAYLGSAHVQFASLASSRQPIARPLAPSTIAGYRRTLGAFWRWAAGERLLTDDQRGYLARWAAPRQPIDPRPALEQTTIDRLLAACGDAMDARSARNRAMVAMLADTGARISEVCRLTDETTDPRGRRARVLRSKNGRHRMIFWQSATAAHLSRYLLLRAGRPGGALFRGCSGRNPGGAISPDAFRNEIKRIADAAGVDLPPGAPLHAFRHGFAHRAIDAGAQLTDLADLLGHADLDTTRIYVRNDDSRLERAYRRIFGERPEGRSGDSAAEHAG